MGCQCTISSTENADLDIEKNKAQKSSQEIQALNDLNSNEPYYLGMYDFKDEKPNVMKSNISIDPETADKQDGEYYLKTEKSIKKIQQIEFKSPENIKYTNPSTIERMRNGDETDSPHKSYKVILRDGKNIILIIYISTIQFQQRGY